MTPAEDVEIWKFYVCTTQEYTIPAGSTSSSSTSVYIYSYIRAQNHVLRTWYIVNKSYSCRLYLVCFSRSKMLSCFHFFSGHVSIYACRYIHIYMNVHLSIVEQCSIRCDMHQVYQVCTRTYGPQDLGTRAHVRATAAGG